MADRRTGWGATCIALVTTFIPALTLAQSPDGVLQSIAIDAEQPNFVYTAGNGKVFRSSSRGAGWASSTDNLLGWSLAVRSADISVDPGDLPIIYAGTQGQGVLRSMDGGISWNGDANFIEEVRSVVVHPDGQTVYAGAESGLFVSTDQGSTWQLLADELSGGHIQGLVIDRSNPNNLYASVWGEGIYSSTDAGQNWNLGAAGLFDTQLFDLDIDPGNPSILYASTWSGVFQSVDAGANWSKLATPQRTSEFAIDPVNPLRMFLTTEGTGVWRSLDGGQNWEQLDQITDASDFTSVAISPDGSGYVYAGSVNRGIYVSSDYGETWMRYGGSDNGGSTGGTGDTGSGPGGSTSPSPSGTFTMEIVDLQKGGSVKSGKDARFRIVIRNVGSTSIENLRYEGYWVRTRLIGSNDPMPFRLTASQGSCGSSRSCSLGDLAVGGQVTVEFYGETTRGTLGWYRMSARAEADNTGSLSQSAEIGTSVTVASSDSSAGGGSAGVFFTLGLILLASRRRGRMSR